MNLERTLELALKYINRAEKISRDSQKDNEDTRRDYEAMEYSLATARQEVTAANYIAAVILLTKETR